MSQRLEAKRKQRKRIVTLSWVGTLAIVVFLLIYKEQTALLYVLATLGVTTLLLVVAFANLEGKNTPAD